MQPRHGALFSLLLAGAARALGTNVTATCEQIAAAISSESMVYWPSDTTGHYTVDNYHYATSSSAASTCSVEPGTPQDVGIILQILGKTQTPFGVKSGGHTMNPGWSSSSTGVEVALYRFNQVNYDSSSQTVQVGSGLIWDDVYAALEPFGVNVCGGRVTGIGVGGFSLGGGYTWLTNQYGLTIDNIVEYELVLPSGKVVTVSADSYSDLYFGLKGGYNNFGIVTQFTMNTHPQGQVWGGILQIDGTLYAEQFNNASVNWIKNTTDPKAGMIMAYDFAGSDYYLLSAILFYDAPTPPPGIFDEFLAIPNLSSSVTTQSFLSLVTSNPANQTANYRGYFHTVSVEALSPSVIEEVYNQSLYYGNLLGPDGNVLVSYDIEPFLSSILTHGTPSAWPPSRGQRYLPINIYYAWASNLTDETYYDALVASQAAIYNSALAEGQNISEAGLYPNYALYGTSIEKLYGANAPILHALKVMYDTNNIMGLTGGWKF